MFHPGLDSMKVGHIYPKYVSVMECDADNLSSYFEFDKNNEPGCSLMKTQARRRTASITAVSHSQRFFFLLRQKQIMPRCGILQRKIALAVMRSITPVPAAPLP
jgi:hypothetical protein